MTRENQVVNDELAAVVAQRDALKRDLDEALHRLSISQQMVQAREKERQDILMSYRALNEEKQRSDTGTSRVAMELHTVRAQVFIFSFSTSFYFCFKRSCTRSACRCTRVRRS